MHIIARPECKSRASETSKKSENNASGEEKEKRGLCGIYHTRQSVRKAQTTSILSLCMLPLCVLFCCLVASSDQG